MSCDGKPVTVLEEEEEEMSYYYAWDLLWTVKNCHNSMCSGEDRVSYIGPH